MVPVHHPNREHLTAVGAGQAFFDRGHPCSCFRRACKPACEPRGFSTLVVVPTVVGTPTFPAVGELSSARPVKFSLWFPQPAYRTALNDVVVGRYLKHGRLTAY